MNTWVESGTVRVQCLPYPWTQHSSPSHWLTNSSATVLIRIILPGPFQGPGTAFKVYNFNTHYLVMAPLLSVYLILVTEDWMTIWDPSLYWTHTSPVDNWKKVLNIYIVLKKAINKLFQHKIFTIWKMCFYIHTEHESELKFVG